MRYLGVDYGSKRVGIALSDESATLAFPKEILENNKGLIETIKKICQEEKVEGIVVGESYDEKGEPNKIMAKIFLFKKKITDEIGLPVYGEKEFFTTIEARKVPGKVRPSPKRTSHLIPLLTDASAAALILQRFLDKKQLTINN